VIYFRDDETIAQPGENVKVISIPKWRNNVFINGCADKSGNLGYNV
jgi:hypothetical protein